MKKRKELDIEQIEDNACDLLNLDYYKGVFGILPRKAFGDVLKLANEIEYLKSKISNLEDKLYSLESGQLK